MVKQIRGKFFNMKFNISTHNSVFYVILILFTGNYKFTDSSTNPGYVIASKSEGQYTPDTSIKLLVYHSNCHAITFTCDGIIYFYFLFQTILRFIDYNSIYVFQLNQLWNMLFCMLFANRKEKSKKTYLDIHCALVIRVYLYT